MPWDNDLLQSSTAVVSSHKGPRASVSWRSGSKIPVIRMSQPGFVKGKLLNLRFVGFLSSKHPQIALRYSTSLSRKVLSLFAGRFSTSRSFVPTAWSNKKWEPCIKWWTFTQATSLLLGQKNLEESSTEKRKHLRIQKSQAHTRSRNSHCPSAAQPDRLSGISCRSSSVSG